MATIYKTEYAAMKSPETGLTAWAMAKKHYPGGQTVIKLSKAQLSNMRHTCRYARGLPAVVRGYGPWHYQKDGSCTAVRLQDK